MILVKTYTKDNNIEEVSIKGHANYKEYGKDIVCSAVSSIAICTINAIYSFSDNSIEVEESDGYLHIKILKQDDITITLIKNMIRCLKDIESNYPTNIKIK